MKQFKNILFVTDPELKSTDAFERAVTLAENNQAQLTVVSTLESMPVGYEPNIQNISLSGLEKSLADKLLSQLENLVAPARKKIQINVKILTGKAFLQIIREAIRNNIDLVIKTAEEGGIADRVFGSTDLHLLRKCPCPVLLIKSNRQGPFKKIMAAVDFEPFVKNQTEYTLNRQILELATSLALSEGCDLHIIHVWQAYGESSLRSGFAKQPETEVDAYVDKIRSEHKSVLDELIAEFSGKSGEEAIGYLKPELHLIKGVAKLVIPDVATENEIDLVVMGTVGRTGIPGFIMGNTAETILRQIDCSIFAVKPEGFITPITLQD